MVDQATQTQPFWLSGNFAPVFEERSETDLRVTGEIPRELNGLYVRNGANPPSGKSLDWFLGCGMLHGIEISDGKPRWYRNRYVQTPLLDEEVPSPESRAKLENSIANTHVIGHAGKILALAELSLPIEVNGELETLGPYRFGGKLHGNMTAHPKVCPITGELLFFGYSMRPPSSCAWARPTLARRRESVHRPRRRSSSGKPSTTTSPATPEPPSPTAAPSQPPYSTGIDAQQNSLPSCSMVEANFSMRVEPSGTQRPPKCAGSPPATGAASDAAPHPANAKHITSCRGTHR